MKPSFACIGGHAAYDLLRDGALDAKRIGSHATPFGESQPIYLCQSPAGEFLFLSRHGERGYERAPSFINYRANIYALKDLGARAVFSWTEARAINHNHKIGQFVVVDDVIDETHRRPNTFFENQGLGVVRQWPVFCPTLRQAATDSLRGLACPTTDAGVYVCIEGPRRETPAEARKFAMMGADLLGMTLVPEVFLAKELQLCYASVAYVAGYAETGSEFRPFEDGRVLEADVQRRRAAAAVERLPRMLARLCEVLARTPSLCRCEQSMEPHISTGQIGLDWRTWFASNGDGASRHHAAPALLR